MRGLNPRMTNANAAGWEATYGCSMPSKASMRR